jgi:hypothetical protein
VRRGGAKTEVVVRSLWLLLLVAACGKHGAGDPARCEAVGARVRTLARADLDANTALAAARRHDAELQLGPLESEVARVCRDTSWPVETRRCMVAAASGAALESCAAALTPKQRAVIEKTEADAPAP